MTTSTVTVTVNTVTVNTAMSIQVRSICVCAILQIFLQLKDLNSLESNKCVCASLLFYSCLFSCHVNSFSPPFRYCLNRRRSAGGSSSGPASCNGEAAAAFHIPNARESRPEGEGGGTGAPLHPAVWRDWHYRWVFYRLLFLVLFHM